MGLFGKRRYTENERTSTSTHQASPTLDPAVLKEARNQCHKARDEFYQCVEDVGVTFSVGEKVPKECRGKRREFERCCKSSWVRHFDQGRDRELHVLNTLKDNIRSSSKTAVGGLSGTDQRG